MCSAMKTNVYMVVVVLLFFVFCFCLFGWLVCGHSLVTLSLTINEILKWLSSLPVLMRSYSGGDSVAISIPPTPHPHLSVPNKPYGFRGR